MVIVFFLGVFMLLISLLGAFFLTNDRGDRTGANVGVAVFGVAVFLVATAFSTMGTVDTKNVGVVTSFKKPTGEVKEAGLYFKAPWTDVTDMSLAWQTETYQFKVQAAAGTEVGLEVLPRWRMVPEAAPELFQNYKDFDGVVNNLFKTELKDSANKLFAVYNPLTNIDVKTGQPVKTKESWAADLKLEMEKRLAGKIVFERVAIPTIAPDEKTQEKLNQQIEEFGRGKVLDQQKVNADKQKAITETNAQVDKQTRCLEIAEKVGGQPGLCLNGSSGVIVNSGK